MLKPNVSILLPGRKGFGLFHQNHAALSIRLFLNFSCSILITSCREYFPTTLEGALRGRGVCLTQKSASRSLIATASRRMIVRFTAFAPRSGPATQRVHSVVRPVAVRPVRQ